MDIITVIITLIPWIELRGSIPIAVAKKEFALIPLILILNSLLFFPVYFSLELFYKKFLHKSGFIRRKLDSTRKKGKPYVDKFGLLGLAIFIGIPLPGSGVYTGSMLAWVLGINWKKGFFASVLGVIIAGTAVTLLSLGIFSI